MNSTEPSAPTVSVDVTDSANAIILPIFAFLAMAVTYLPMKSFCRARNFPAGNIVAISILQNLMIITNALIWRNGNMETWWHGAILCDIQVYLRVPSTTAVATSFVAFTRTLSNAINVDKHNFVDRPARRRRALIIDILICWTIPLLQIALNYVVMLTRYAIIPVYGCAVVQDPSWVTVLIFLPWAPLSALYSGFEAIRILWRLRTHRANLGKILSSNNSGHTTRRYIKLLLLGLSFIIIVIPLEFFYMWQNIVPQYIPYSWSRVHDPTIWFKVIYYPTSAEPRVQYSGWTTVSLSFLMFLFFGFNDDAIEDYRRWLVVLGFGRVWPSLKESRSDRAIRRRQSTSRPGSGNSSDWRSHLDLVSKIASKYFDNPRKNSQATTISGSAYVQSRKNSQATFSTVALTAVASNTSSQGPTSSSTYRSFFDEVVQDEIAPATALRAPNVLQQVIEEPAPVATTAASSGHGGILGTWKTQFNLPFSMFDKSKTRCHTHSNSFDQTQSSPNSIASTLAGAESRSPNASRKSSLANHTFPPPTISTVIWSDTPIQTSTNTPQINTKTTTHTQTHVSNHSLANNVDIDADEFHHPLSPKLGSRAYRERERREMERDRKERQAQKVCKGVAGDSTSPTADDRRIM